MFRVLAVAAFAMLGGAMPAKAMLVPGTFDDSSTATFAVLTPVAGSAQAAQYYSASPGGATGDVAQNTGFEGQNPQRIAQLLGLAFGEPQILVGFRGFGPGSAGGGDDFGNVTVIGAGMTSGSVATPNAFEFASMKGGDNQWLIDFGGPITSFSFQDLEAGFSNVRLTITPLPGAALLFAPALAALLWTRRRRAA